MPEPDLGLPIRTTAFARVDGRLSDGNRRIERCGRYKLLAKQRMWRDKVC